MDTSERNQIIRFALTGLLVNGTDLGIYYVLFHFLPKPIAKGISFTCGGIVAYLVNKYWTFKQERQSSGEVVKFIVANGLALILNISTNQLILYFSPTSVLPAVITATLATSVFTYFIFKFWVFTKIK